MWPQAFSCTSGSKPHSNHVIDVYYTCPFSGAPVTVVQLQLHARRPRVSPRTHWSAAFDHTMTPSFPMLFTPPCVSRSVYISGLPGTGKSHTVRAVLDVLRQQQVSYPTFTCCASCSLCHQLCGSMPRPYLVQDTSSTRLERLNICSGVFCKTSMEMHICAWPWLKCICPLTHLPAIRLSYCLLGGVTANALAVSICVQAGWPAAVLGFPELLQLRGPVRCIQGTVRSMQAVNNR